MPPFFQTVFIGSGISCLAAARRLGGDYLIVEREDSPGGLCRSEQRNGYFFDRTGHLLHLHRPEVRRLVRNLLRGNLIEHKRNSFVFSHGVFTRYPFQSHFYGLPKKVITECLLGLLRVRCRPARRAQNFADWVRNTFGDAVAENFHLPYNRKLWTVPPEELALDWLGRFIPVPDLEQVVRGALEDVPDASGYNARFFYPRRGGIQALVEGLAKGLRISYGRAVRRVDLARRVIELADGDTMAFGHLVSCAPLPELVTMCRPLPPKLRRAAARLRWAGVYNLNLGLRVAAPARHWVYVPERRFRLYRFGYASNFSPHMAPPGFSNLYLEASFPGGTRPNVVALRERLLGDLERIGVLGSRRQIDLMQEFVLPYAYVIHDRFRPRAVRAILRFFAGRGVYSIGRYGRWEYSSMEDALWQGMRLAARLRRGHG